MDRVCLQLRIPKALHQAMVAAAKESEQSLNTHICERLRDSLRDKRTNEIEARVAELERKAIVAMIESVHRG